MRTWLRRVQRRGTRRDQRGAAHGERHATRTRLVASAAASNLLFSADAYCSTCFGSRAAFRARRLHGRRLHLACRWFAHGVILRVAFCVKQVHPMCAFQLVRRQGPVPSLGAWKRDGVGGSAVPAHSRRQREGGARVQGAAPAARCSGASVASDRGRGVASRPARDAAQGLGLTPGLVAFRPARAPATGPGSAFAATAAPTCKLPAPTPARHPALGAALRESMPACSALDLPFAFEYADRRCATDDGDFDVDCCSDCGSDCGSDDGCVPGAIFLGRSAPSFDWHGSPAAVWHGHSSDEDLMCAGDNAGIWPTRPSLELADGNVPAAPSLACLSPGPVSPPPRRHRGAKSCGPSLLPDSGEHELHGSDLDRECARDDGSRGIDLDLDVHGDEHVGWGLGGAMFRSSAGLALRAPRAGGEASGDGLGAAHELALTPAALAGPGVDGPGCGLQCARVHAALRHLTWEVMRIRARIDACAAPAWSVDCALDGLLQSAGGRFECATAQPPRGAPCQGARPAVRGPLPSTDGADGGARPHAPRPRAPRPRAPRPRRKPRSRSPRPARPEPTYNGFRA